MGFQFETHTIQRHGCAADERRYHTAEDPAGELVYLNLPNHPGSGTDHTPPNPPTNVQMGLDTNMGYQGVGVTWSPGSDNNWVSDYNVLRDGKVIGEVSQGDYFFDHTAGGSPAPPTRSKPLTVTATTRPRPRPKAGGTEQHDCGRRARRG